MQRYLLVIAYTFLLLLFAYVVQKSVKYSASHVTISSGSYADTVMQLGNRHKNKRYRLPVITAKHLGHSGV